MTILLCVSDIINDGYRLFYEFHRCVHFESYQCILANFALPIEDCLVHESIGWNSLFQLLISVPVTFSLVPILHNET